MKRPLCLRVALFSLIAGLLVCFSHSTFGQSLTNSTNFNLNLVIPDGDDEGIADTQNILSDIFALDSVEVFMNISGGYTSDLYVYLRHGTGFSVLLNRPGLASTNLDGYVDSGLNITFSDSSPNDIHFYQTIINPNGGILTGVWQPDGRNVDPDLVSENSPRTADLSSFTGLNPDGEWSLFLVDNAAIGEFVLHSWGMRLIGTAVPEPSSIVLAGLSAGVFLLCFHRRS